MPDNLSTPITSIWGLLSDVLKGFANSKGRLFENHIEPLHAKMMQIHVDYIKGFQGVKTLLVNGLPPPDDLIRFLKDRRIEQAAIRDLTKKLAEELNQLNRLTLSGKVLNELSDYCHAILDYFSVSSSTAGLSFYTDFINAVETSTIVGLPNVWDFDAFGGNPRLWLLEGIDRILNDKLDKAISLVNAKYAVLRKDLI